jgi:hypothetical protein
LSVATVHVTVCSYVTGLLQSRNHPLP